MQCFTCVLFAVVAEPFELKSKTNNKNNQKSVWSWCVLLKNSSKATKTFQKCQTTTSLSGAQNSAYKIDLVMGLLAEYSSSCGWECTRATLLGNLWLSQAFFMEFQATLTFWSDGKMPVQSLVTLSECLWITLTVTAIIKPGGDCFGWVNDRTWLLLARDK